MGQQQSNQNAQRRRRGTALAAGFVTGSSGKVEEKYQIDVSLARRYILWSNSCGLMFNSTNLSARTHTHIVFTPRLCCSSTRAQQSLRSLRSKAHLSLIIVCRE